MKCSLIKCVSVTSASLSLLAASVAVSLLFGSTALAAPIAAEYFDYGPTAKNLGSLGTAGDGWVGAWTELPTNNNSPDYSPSANLDLNAKYPSAQYDNSANVGGMAGYFLHVTNNFIVYRDFSVPQTGTIWLSAILRYADTASTNEHVLLRLHNEASGGNVDGVGIFNGKASMMYRTGGTDNLLGTQAIGSGVYLLLAKVDMNYSGTFDRLTMWIDPNLSNGEAGLNAWTLMQEGKNALGSSLLGVGLAVTGDTNEGLDAIRVGTTLADVTAVPEPATLAMLILGGLPMVIRRRRA